MDNSLNILVVDDTIFYRKLLSKIIEDIPDADVAGIASNGELAVKKIELAEPDLVLMDVAMPKMDGLQALKIIKENHPDVDVVMVSGIDVAAAEMTVKALETGALDFIPKPRTTSPEAAVEELLSALIPLIKLARIRKNTRKAHKIFTDQAPAVRPQAVRPEQPETRRATHDAARRAIPKIDLVAVGVSTGGPNVLKRIIPGLAADLPVPILAVQHMPPMFTASLAESLDSLSSIRVKEGRAEQIVENGVMYIAPGGRHMVVRDAGDDQIKLGLLDSPPVHNCRPAVDVLFRSIGLLCGGNVLTVILTGMGSDGVSGVAAIRRKGGYCLIQDEITSVVWGMPGAVAAADEADEIHPEDRIAQRIMQIVERGRL